MDKIPRSELGQRRWGGHAPLRFRAILRLAGVGSARGHCYPKEAHSRGVLELYENWVETGARDTAPMYWSLIQALRWPITTAAARCRLDGPGDTHHPVVVGAPTPGPGRPQRDVHAEGPDDRPPLGDVHLRPFGPHVGCTQERHRGVELSSLGDLHR